MITGLHAIVHAKNADEVRVFLRDVLGFKSVDAGHGWLIFAAPPAEIAAHPIEEGEKPHHELYLMCDDLQATMKELEGKGVQCRAVTARRWRTRSLPTQAPDSAGTCLELKQAKQSVAQEFVETKYEHLDARHA
jgi:hypothetical protein